MTPEAAVKHALHDLGHMPMTDGSVLHKLPHAAMRIFVGPFVKRKAFGGMKKAFEVMVEKGRAKKAE